jgi:hypothetical protein
LILPIVSCNILSSPIFICIVLNTQPIAVL